jgi:hypothetical protein
MAAALTTEARKVHILPLILQLRTCLAVLLFCSDTNLSALIPCNPNAAGTDFGKTSGGLDGVATNTKATEGDFLADAKQNTREGVKIAEKNTKDAANVEWGRDVSKQSRGAGTIGDGIEKAKSIATGGATTDLKSASNKVLTLWQYTYSCNIFCPPCKCIRVPVCFMRCTSYDARC